MKRSAMWIRSGVLSGAAIAGLSLSAKTVALWPIDFDVDNQEYNLRCATDAKYDFTFSNAGKTFETLTGASTLPWNLPPNPDTSEFRFTPVTYTSLESTTQWDGYLMANLGDTLVSTRAFTFECFVKFTGSGSLGTSAAWVVLTTVGMNSLADPFRHQFRMAYDGTTDKYYLHLWTQNSTIDRHFPDKALTLAELRDGNWHHVAYTQLPNDGSGYRVFEAFWDGESAGKLSDAASTVTQSNGKGLFLLGTRAAYGNTIKGAMDYVRISDEVLTPSQFLNAGGGSGTVITAPTTKTVGYWRLGKDANGGVDGASSVGGWPFVRSYWDSTDCRSTLLTADSEGAFEGQPPNPTVTLTGGNKGSFAVGKVSMAAVVSFPELGSSLACSKDFTVETYFRPDNPASDVTGSLSFFGAYDTGTAGLPGWRIYLVTNARSSNNYGRRFRLCANDSTGAFHTHEDFGSFIAGWTDAWKHIALVHHATGGSKGYGYWQIYLDGELYGTLEDSRAVADAATVTFRLGTCDMQSALGKFDCLRISEAALTPNQFICATNGVMATNVKAFFPLDISTSGSAYSVFTDVVGNNTKGTVLAANSVAAATDDAPVVTNPDRSPAFRSRSGGVTGSVGFAGYASNAYAALYSMDSTAILSLNATGAGRECTVEGYVKSDNASATEQIFLGSSTIQTASWPDMTFRIAYGATDGFVLSDLLVEKSTFKDFKTGVKLTANEWHHFALTCSITSESDTDYGTWRLYVDGACAFTSSVCQVAANRSLVGLEVGGRHWGGGSFHGKIAHLRISKGVLDPSEFLCATPAATPAETTSYWPLNYRNGVVETDNRVATLQPLTASDVVAGSAERAAYKPVTATIPAEAERNLGSVALADGCLVSVAAAEKIGNLAQPFTVEGYVKWTAAAVKNRAVVCGTFRNDHGWKLVLDNTGDAPVFRIFGSGRLPTSPFVNAAIGSAPAGFANTWHHLALAYDPVESGTWRLSVDGATVGVAANRWNPVGIDIRQPIFLIGADASDADATFVGGLDLWRISTGSRAVADYLYPSLPFPGLMMLFR